MQYVIVTFWFLTYLIVEVGVLTLGLVAAFQWTGKEHPIARLLIVLFMAYLMISASHLLPNPIR